MMDLIDKRDRTQLFRDRLEAAMQAAGISRAGLARAVGVDRSTVTQMLSGKEVRMPGGHVVAGLATTLGVSADWLLGLSDQPEQVGDLLATSLSISETGRATGTDDQIFAWHEEAAGYKIRHVPATLPDVLKTDGLMRWEYAPETVKTPGQAIAAAHARLEWMRGTTSDYEIAVPMHELESFAFGTGYYAGLDPVNRREQLDWLITVYEQLYPTLRVFLFDARIVYSAPLTVFGPRLAVIYVGHHYVTFRDRERVRTMSRHFDWLVREAVVSDRSFVQHVETLRQAV
ncbi:helix-turn-helix transcriptional regulator [Roseibacterium sp. SDUM158017]|uniref:helix-turn-helix domain-containing protein n=1 Tax=Roseicyclus salinarum TaxID=3036773 RepID=UPI00241574F6|nr:helix-turn-helix transcriptional regulator [Roseibacterium sp. SDUM158017]MDG4648600.1 helix-turn-helix transcriptional regulator [Roseibacterium sp. SDUM158017]